MSKTTNAKKILLIAVAALTVAGSVAGAALAAGARKAPKPAAAAVELSTPDTDNVQSGDQTSPDVGILSATRISGIKAETTTSAGETGSQDPSTEASGENNGGASDGPGGHEDPPGDVNHEFNGTE